MKHATWVAGRSWRVRVKASSVESAEKVAYETRATSTENRVSGAECSAAAAISRAQESASPPTTARTSRGPGSRRTGIHSRAPTQDMARPAVPMKAPMVCGERCWSTMRTEVSLCARPTPSQFRVSPARASRPIRRAPAASRCCTGEVSTAAPADPGRSRSSSTGTAVTTPMARISSTAVRWPSVRATPPPIAVPSRMPIDSAAESRLRCRAGATRMTRASPAARSQPLNSPTATPQTASAGQERVTSRVLSETSTSSRKTSSWRR